MNAVMERSEERDCEKKEVVEGQRSKTMKTTGNGEAKKLWRGKSVIEMSETMYVEAEGSWRSQKVRGQILWRVRSMESSEIKGYKEVRERGEV